MNNGRNNRTWICLVLGAVLQGYGLVSLADSPTELKKWVDFTLSDLQGEEHTLSDYSGSPIVLEWINYKCPFVLKFYESGVMPALQARYREQGVVWLAVYSAQPGEPRYYSAAEALRLSERYGARHTAYLLDTDGDVARRYGAQTTPHVFVIRPDGRIAYNGAVDSVRSHFQFHLAEAENHLESALDAVLAAQPVPLTTTRAYGSLVNLIATRKLQAEMDAASLAGGGRISLPAGRLVVGAITLRSDIELNLPAGAVLQGSDNWRDYGEGRWNDALITGIGMTNVVIAGPGTIDMVDVYNEYGQATIPYGADTTDTESIWPRGRRGGHMFSLRHAEDVRLHNITLTRAGNYAIDVQDSRNFVFDHVTFLGGYDGLNAERCHNFHIMHCDFRTGDDAVAGLDNQQFIFEDTSFNSSCNGIRMSGQHITFRRCRFWGPGEFPHRGGHRIFIDPESTITGDRTNMLAAFSHFAPNEPHIAAHTPSDHWLIEEVQIERVDSVYIYNHGHGWQHAQPVKNISFVHVTAHDVGLPFLVYGSPDWPVRLSLDHVSISPYEGAVGPIIKAQAFDRLAIAHTRLLGIAADSPVLQAEQGREIILDLKTSYPADPERYHLSDIENINIQSLP